MNDNSKRDPRLLAIPDTHGHCKGEHKPFVEERPLPLTARMLFLWFYHACRRGYPRFMMVADHMNYLTFEDPAAVNLVRRALKLAQAGDLYGAAETANVDVGHATVVGEGLRRGMRFSIGAEVDNDPRSRPDAQNIVDAMRPDAMIRSVHFIPITHPVHGENWAWPFDNPEFREFFETVGVEQTWELYVNALVDAIERLPGHIVGHFFVPAVFGHWPDDAKLDAYEDRVLAAAAERGMAIEFNTRFLYREHTDDEKQRYLDANKRLLRKAKERGVGIAIGSDAHSPKDQAGAFTTVLAVLDELEINEIVFPIAGRLLRVALKVERKPEPEPVPVPVPAAPAAPAPEPAKAERPKPVRRAPAPAPSAEPAEPLAAAAAAAPAQAPRPARKRPAAKAAPEPATAPAAEAVAAEAPVAVVAAPAPQAEPALAAVPAVAPKSAPAPKRAAVKPPGAPAKPAPAAKPAAKAAPAKAASAPAAPPAKTVKPAAKPAPKPAAKAAPKAPVKLVKAAAKAKPAAKPPAKPAAAKKKAAPAKAAAKKAPASRATPAKKAASAAKKAAPAKKSPATKKTSPAKKSAVKKTPARSAPARKAPAAKKTTAKKTATKRR